MKVFLQQEIARVIGTIAKNSVLKNIRGEFDVKLEYSGHVEYLFLWVKISDENLYLIDGLRLEPFEQKDHKDYINQLNKIFNLIVRANKLLSKLHKGHTTRRRMTFDYDEEGHLAGIEFKGGAA